MLVSLQEASKKLGVSIFSLRRWIKGKKIPVYKLGERSFRLDLDEVMRLSREEAKDHRQPE